MPLPHVRATDLYELASCPHRIALDRRLARLQRTEPDDATRLLLERGRLLEGELARGLGYRQPEYESGDFEAGARETEALLRSGVQGVYQAVLLRDRFLALPDLLERTGTPSGFGEFSYVPGDIKSGLAPRSDHVLQVAFAGWLLERIQGRPPRAGFLLLGDGARMDFDLAELGHVLAAARERVTAIADAVEETFPFLDPACGHCRWRSTCVPELLVSDDLSLVDGMTRTRRRVLVREGVRTVAELAGLDVRGWTARGLPALALDSLVRQARALACGRVAIEQPLEIPAAAPHLFAYAERDPLDGGGPSLLAWGVPGAVTTEILLSGAERAAAVRRFAAASSGKRVYYFGSALARALEQLAALAQLGPDEQATLEAGLFNLAASLRRGTAYLPVRRYTLEEVGAVLAGLPLPDPGTGPTPPFVLAEHLRRGTPGPWAERLRAHAAAQIAQLHALQVWIRAQPNRPPRRVA